MLFASRRLTVLISIVGLAGLTALAGSVVPAHAGTIAVVSCKTPANTPAPTEGWEEGWTSAAFSDAGDNNECASGGSLASYVGDSVPQPGSSGPYWQYTPPSGDQIVGGQVTGSFSVAPGSGYSGAAGLLGPKFLFDSADVIGGDAGGLAGTYEGTYSLTNHTGGNLWIYAFCEPPGATCPAGGSTQWYWAVAFMESAIIELSNGSSPTGSNFGGPIAGSAPVSGTQSLTFQAADSGSGVYQVKLTLDGQTIYDATPDTNFGACVPIGSYAGVSEFISAEPCKRSESVSIPVNTTAFTDAAHELQVSVIDAASNQSIVYDGTLTTDNAPTVTSPPSISGSAQVGSTLGATNAVFAARSKALEPLGVISGQWLRCSGAAGGCSPIAGATASTYAPSASDDGYTIEYENTVEDADKHRASEVSAPTVAVAEPGGSNGSNGSGSNGANGGAGGNGGSSGTGGSGSGSGVTVNLTGSSSSLGSTLLGSTSKWGVSLKVTPRKVRRHSKIKLSGLVTTSPRPDNGKLIYLQARSVQSVTKGRGHKRHRVTVYGKWVMFQAFRAKSNGGFTSSYTFKLGGQHTYQFQAIAPAEGQYRNPTGTSKTITVKEV